MICQVNLLSASVKFACQVLTPPNSSGNPPVCTFSPTKEACKVTAPLLSPVPLWRCSPSRREESLADFHLGGGFHSRSVGSAHAAWLTTAWRSSPGDLTVLASVDTYMFIPTHRHVHPSKTKACLTDAEDWRADREVCRSCLSHSRAVLGRGHKGSISVTAQGRRAAYDHSPSLHRVRALVIVRP